MTRLTMCLSSLSLLGAAETAPSSNSSVPSIYVDAKGDDQANGRDPGHPVRSLTRARDLMRLRGAPKVTLLSGNFVLDASLRLNPADAGTTWRAAPGKQASLFAAQGVPIGIAIQGADRVTIAGLRLLNFQTDGIRAAESQAVSIIGNQVIDTHSSAWSQAAIHLVGNVTGSTVTGNTIEGADYSGIAVTTNAQSVVNRITIVRNTVSGTCRKVHDCGGIYISDRGRRSEGSIIANNVIRSFGSTATGARGIYLDDWASGIRVRGNRLSGPGAYAIHIHGGSRNLIEKNVIDARLIDYPLYIQPVDGDITGRMAANVVRHNMFIVSAAGRKLIRFLPAVTHSIPSLTTNKVCASIAAQQPAACHRVR